MSKESVIQPEVFHSELDFIKTRINDAMAKTGLSTTFELYHQINWAISLRLQQTFGMEIRDFNKHHIQTVDSSNPKIYYVSHGGNLRKVSQTEENWFRHSFLLVAGVESEILLIDGANDQADPSTPFLVAGIGKRFDNNRLRMMRHDVRFQDQAKFDLTMNGIAQNIPRALKILLKNRYISSDEYRIAEEQFAKESAAGMGFLFLGFSRDWICYFARALGLDYVSTQRVQEAFWTTVGKKKQSDPYKEHLDDLVRSLLGQ